VNNLINEWDKYADNWDTDPAVEEYARKAFLALPDDVELDGLTVLDFGCGTGALTQLISPKVKNIIAIDPSSKMIEYLNIKSLKNVLTIPDFLSKELICQYSLLENKFDLIIASSVCSFLPDYEATLNLLKSLLKSEGVFIQWDWLSRDDASEMGLTHKRVKQALEMNKFTRINISTPFIMESSKGSMPVLMAIGKNT
jgi:2-polyprenyl-3-methyl-5-hydroxy-6-metoxy-1,4-benzoquinol methylase